MHANQPLGRILTTLALLIALFAVDAASASHADAQSHNRAKSLATSGRISARHSAVKARHKRKLRRKAAPRQHAVGDAIGLTAPAQAPANRPAQASAQQPTELLFDGSHIADFDQLQSAPGAITEVADPAGGGGTAFQMNVSDRDVYPVTPTENPRAQALSPTIIDAGDEFWLQTKFMLPENLPAVHGWMSLVSIYGAPFEGSSPWQIEVVNNEIRWERNGSYDWDIPWRMPLVKGRWVTVLLHERFANDGWVEMWIDGQQVSFFGRDQRLEMATMDSSNDEGANAAKIMQYREADMFDSASVYFGPLKLGSSRAAVGG
jgi:hypothetical protein